MITGQLWKLNKVAVRSLCISNSLKEIFSSLYNKKYMFTTLLFFYSLKSKNKNLCSLQKSELETTLCLIAYGYLDLGDMV